MPEFIQFPQGIVIVHITTGCTSRSMAMAEKWNSSHIFLSSIYCAMDFKVVTCFLCSLILLLRASSLRTYDRSAFCINNVFMCSVYNIILIPTVLLNVLKWFNSYGLGQINLLRKIPPIPLQEMENMEHYILVQSKTTEPPTYTLLTVPPLCYRSFRKIIFRAFTIL